MESGWPFEAAGWGGELECWLWGSGMERVGWVSEVGADGDEVGGVEVDEGVGDLGSVASWSWDWVSGMEVRGKGRVGMGGELV